MKTEIERERILWIGEIAKLKNKLNDTSKSLIGSESLINYFNVMKHDAFKIDQLFYDYKIGLYDPQKKAAKIEEICSKNYNIMPFQICVKSVIKSLKELSEISKNILIAIDNAVQNMNKQNNVTIFIQDDASSESNC